jgi:hypothetical protein
MRGVAGVSAITLALAAVLLSQPALADTAPPDPTNPATPPTVSADLLPTPQINGVVWAQVVVGNTVYVAGNFTTARPFGSAPGVNTVTRNYVLAYNLTTGALLPWAPSLNAQAINLAASPDGTRVYVVGDFTTVNGAAYYRAAAFSTSTGAIIPAFRPIMGSETRSVAASNTTVYLGGYAQTVNGASRLYLSAVSAANGSTLSWRADANAPVNALTLTTDGSKLIVGGRFTTLGGVSAISLGAVNATTAQVLPWAVNQLVHDSGTNSSITSLYATPTAVYGSGYNFLGGNGAGNLEGSFSADPSTGAVIWIEDCHGDTYSVFSPGPELYIAGHPHYCGNLGSYPETSPRVTHHAVAFSKAATGTITADPYGYHNWAGNPAPTVLDWFPTFLEGTFTGQGQATWSVAGNASYVLYGGEFPSVNGVSQQGLARFAVASIAPNKVGPMGIPLTPVAIAEGPGQVRVAWPATYDMDNGYLTYKVYRDNGTTPIFQSTVHSNFYTRPGVGFIDNGLVAGSTHTYNVVVTDPFGNSNTRTTNVVTVSGAALGAYAASVTGAGAASYWPLNEASGPNALDRAGFTDIPEPSAIGHGTAGPVPGSTASTFNGSSANGFIASLSRAQGPNTVSVQAWFKTTTTSGGKIIGFGNQNTGGSTAFDRHIYMDNSGHILWGARNGVTLKSTATYNNGAWHQVTGTLGSNGMQLFIDGARIASRTDVTTGQNVIGFWRIGGDSVAGWSSAPSSPYFAGSIGQVAIYPSVLSAATVLAQWHAAGH